MDFYIVDRVWKLQTILSTTGDVAHKVINALDVVNLKPSRRLSLDVSFTQETSNDIKEFTKVGNYVLYLDIDGEYRWQTILKTSHNPLTGIRQLECEDAGLDLLNETLKPYKADKAYNIAHYINKFTFDSGFKIGINQIPKLTRKLEWESDGMTTTERIDSVATQFDNAELSFSFEFDGNKLVQRYINIWKKRGSDTNKILYVNKDIHSINVEENIYDLVNAISATGGTPENKNEPINLKNYKWTDPTGRFLLKTDGLVYDTENIKHWSRDNTSSHYFVRVMQYETTNQKVLLDTVIRYLKQYSTPVTTYTVDVVNNITGLKVGDYIKLVDDNEELYLKSRIQELTYDYSNDDVSLVLADFTKLENGMSDKLKELALELGNKLESNVPIDVEIIYSNPLFLNNKTADNKTFITLDCIVSRKNVNINNQVISYTWSRFLPDGNKDVSFSKNGKSIDIEPDSQKYYTYKVEVEL